MKQRFFYQLFFVVFVMFMFNNSVNAQTSTTKQNDASLLKEKAEKLDYYKSADQSGLKYQAKKLESAPANSKLTYLGKPINTSAVERNNYTSRKELLEHLRNEAIKNGRSTDKYDQELMKLSNQQTIKN
jgi:hypothetical protein